MTNFLPRFFKEGIATFMICFFAIACTTHVFGQSCPNSNNDNIICPNKFDYTLYWPPYYYLPDNQLSTVTASAWNTTNRTAAGWDWSLPSFVNPSPRSAVSIRRFYNLDKTFTNYNLKYKVNPVIDLWVDWKELEPSMDAFNFTQLKIKLNEAKNLNLDVNLRILCHAYKRHKSNGTIVDAEAPSWLKTIGCDLLPRNGDANENYDPQDSIFHVRYKKLITKIGEAGIPALVRYMYIGYASGSLGDEGIGPYDNSAQNDTSRIVRERLDAWEAIFPNMASKIYMGGPVDYGFQKGFGVRRGFVEVYHYTLPDRDLGSYVDAAGYVRTDETSPIPRYKCFNGEVNEEYSEKMGAADTDYRFGVGTKSFPYRYFISMLRTLQMQCTYVEDDGRLIPAMMPFISLELGRTVADAPDVWSFLNTFYLKPSNYNSNSAGWRPRSLTPTESARGSIEAKNYERWLYQRDTTDYTTTPAMPVQQPRKMWMIQHLQDKYEDYIARQGKKMGFHVDDRWTNLNDSLALKVSYFDNYNGKLKVVYHDGTAIQTKDVAILNGDKGLKTATIFIPKIKANGSDKGFDFILTGDLPTQNIVVSMVRLIDAAQTSTGKQNQSINFGPIPPKNINDPNFSPGGTASSGLAVTYESSNPAVAVIVEGNMIDIVGAGNVTITASQGGDNTYNAAPPVLRTFTVTAGPPAAAVTALTGWVQGTSNTKVNGNNRLMVVMVMGQRNTTFSATGIKYGTRDMIKRSERGHNSGAYTYCAIFTLDEAGVNAATSGTIDVAWNGTPTATNHRVYSVLLGNVDQTAAFAEANNGSNGTSITTSSLPAATGDMVVMCGATSDDKIITFNNGFTKSFESDSGWGDGTGGFKLGSGVNETPSFAQSGSSGRMVLCAIVAKRAGGSLTTPESTAERTDVENKSDSPVLVYPNPVSNTLTVEHPKETTIRIFNVQGQLLYDQQGIDNQTTINVADMNVSGMIFVRVLTGDKTIVVPVSIMK